MHDLSFANRIISALKEKIKTLPSSAKITSINAALSPLSHVKPERLTETFGAITKGTEYDNITLNIKVMPLEISCNACKKSFQINKPAMKCIYCTNIDLDMHYIEEFKVNSIIVKEDNPQ